ncbi:MAG TPA: efflux RND transporter periplasmic adaptor subunit [Alphaproteobacteria bacterium]|nr:efflux RND transporter periplasmic adaptor subunit [Alphaproteobacteria bacterium]
MHGSEQVLQVKAALGHRWGRWAAAAALIAAALLAYRLLAPGEVVNPAPAAAAVDRAAGTIRVTERQMSQFDIAPVAAHEFHIQKDAVGQIAFNEDATTPVVPPFSGRVIRLLAKLGDDVKRGMPLLEIESPEVVQAQNDLVAAVQAARKSKAQLLLAQQALARARELFAASAGSKRDLEQGETGYASADFDNRAADAALAASRNRLRLLGRSDAEIASLERDQTVNPTITITAPIDGTVVSRKIGPGQYVRADNTDPLYLIADLSTMWLDANVAERDIGLVHAGQDVGVTVSAFPDRSFKARITYVGASSDPVTHRIVVRSEVSNADRLLKPQMFARFRIDTGKNLETPAIPVDAVVQTEDVTTCWVEVEPRVFQERRIKVGLQQDGLVQVLDGLKPGERVATRGALFLDNAFQD